MGRPNYPCFDIESKYDQYPPVTTSTTTTPNPEDIDFFVIPNSGAICPTPKTYSVNNEDEEFDNPDVTFSCNSPLFSPSPCVITLKKYVRVADIGLNINVNDKCQRFAVKILNEVAPTTTTTTTMD